MVSVYRSEGTGEWGWRENMCVCMGGCERERESDEGWRFQIN